MKKKLLLLLLSLGFIGISSASYLDDWTDDQICGWMDNASPPEYIVDEAIKRNLDCIPESAKKKTQEDTGLQIMIFDADFSQSDLDNLLSTDVEKTDFDFSKYKIANNHRNLLCQFSIHKVRYQDLVEGKIQTSSMAEGYLEIDSGKVNINVNKSRWKTRGLSDDPSYLRDEVNLRLTEDGYLVGKMAYFESYTDTGEPPIKPLYVELIKHKKSKPLDYKKPKTERAQLWIEVNDWSDGVLFLSNCTMYEESYKDGKLDGKRTTWYLNGQVQSEVNYKDGKKEGKTTSWYQSGEIVLEVNYKDGKKEGKTTSWYKNGQKKSEENYKDGKLDSKRTTWYENGQIKSEENYKDGKKEGKSTAWYSRGEIKSETSYKDGKKDGKSTGWYPRDEIQLEINYNNGKKEGKFTTWYENGQIKSEVNFKNNKRQGKETTWYENGQKKSEENYKAGNAGFSVLTGQKEGKFTAWYENGQIKSEENYIDNKREGKRAAWYDNGQKKYEGNFKDGKLDGKKTTWHENGQIKSEANYKDGKLIVTE